MKKIIFALLFLVSLESHSMAMKSIDTSQSNDSDATSSLTIDDTSSTEIKQVYVVGLVQNLDVANNIIVVNGQNYTLPDRSHLHLDKTLRIRSDVKMLVENKQVIDLWILR